MAAAAQEISLPAPLRQRIAAESTAMAPALVATRRDIHAHPELGFRETRTAKLIADRLRTLGFDSVREGVGVTGVVGVLKGGRPGKVVAVRADMDALPIPELIDVPYKSTVANVKHACGHDGHVSIALGVAEIVSRMRADIPGTVVFLFQPAEEGDPDGGLTGAQRVLDDNGLSTPAPSAIFGLHVLPTLQAGTIGVNLGAAMASSNRFTITITGKKTHAAYPHTGVDPIPVAAQVVSALQTIPSRLNNAAEPIVLSVATIAGGNRYNIIADSVTMTGTLRTLSKDGPVRVRGFMDRMLKGITEATGTTYARLARGQPRDLQRGIARGRQRAGAGRGGRGSRPRPCAPAADGRRGLCALPAAHPGTLLLPRCRQHRKEDHRDDPHRVLRHGRDRAADRRPRPRRCDAGLPVQEVTRKGQGLRAGFGRPVLPSRR
jgi:amidohydrolase